MPPERVDALPEDQRRCFDATPVCRWRITWPDGMSEVVEGHSVQFYGGDGPVLAFHWHYLGAHRVVNLTHVRDVEEITGSDA